MQKPTSSSKQQQPEQVAGPPTAVSPNETRTAPFASSARRFVLPDPDDVERQLESAARARNTLKQAEVLARKVSQPPAPQSLPRQQAPLGQRQAAPTSSQVQTHRHPTVQNRVVSTNLGSAGSFASSGASAAPAPTSTAGSHLLPPSARPAPVGTAHQRTPVQATTRLQQQLPLAPQISQQQHTSRTQPPGPPRANHQPQQQQQQQQQQQRMVGTSARPTGVGNSCSSIIVSPRQRGNPVLKHLKNVAYQFGPTPADFVLGTTTCALYLSLRYHLLNPDYLYARISELKRSFTLRVILCHADVQDCTDPMLRVSTLAAANEFTVVLVTSLEEAARYLETYKAFENRSAASIKEKVEADYMSRAEDTLTVIRSVNKTDVTTLLQSFGSMRGVMNASVEELSLCHGFGERKVRFVHETFDAPFFPQASGSTADAEADANADADVGPVSGTQSTGTAAVTAPAPATAAASREPSVSIRELFASQSDKNVRRRKGSGAPVVVDSDSSDSDDESD